MAIRNESTSTEELLLDARYHIAALLSDPETESLAPPVKKVEAGLRSARDAADAKEGERVEKLALYERADLHIDQRVRKVDLEILAVADGRRDDEGYKQVFPRGAGTVIALRGAEEAAEVAELSKALKATYPEIFKRHDAELRKRATAAASAETALLEAESAADAAFTSELAARRALVRQLQKNEGALTAIYPGQRALVRSFFRPNKRRAAEPEPVPNPAPAPDPAPNP